MSEPRVLVDCPGCAGRSVCYSTERVVGCARCHGAGKVVAPASNPASGIGTPDEVDRLRDDVRALRARLEAAALMAQELLAIVEPKNGGRRG